MSIFKCKMCGGTLDINNGESVAICEYCGTKQTIPRLDSDKRLQMYDRANHFRRNNDFDKAMGIYEQILNEDNTDSEAYWSLVLCRYGIEYVEDPVNHKRIPTVNRAQYTSIFDDDNYKSALQYADSNQRIIYEEEANAINNIQKGILEISQKEEPFDVFICYKETDSNGRRTQDSVLANDLYHQLTQEGFKVFFSRITLEDKLGTAYEPYIFAALNSSKIMVVLGTKSEYFNAVWVKNEWSRFLALIKNGEKKMLIPAYRDMDPYDLPEEFSHLQAQDMSKLGFIQDLIRGIKKIISTPTKSEAKETVIVNSANTEIAPLLKRAFMYVEDGDWGNANDYCERVLDHDPENAQAYLGKLMTQLQVKTKDKLQDCKQPFDNNSNYIKAVRFGDEKLKKFLNDCIAYIIDRNESIRLNQTYNDAVKKMNSADTEIRFKYAADLFKSISGFKDADIKANECYEKAESARKDVIYFYAKNYMNGDRIASYESAIYEFKKISGWKDADEQIAICQKKIEDIKAKEEENRIEIKRIREEKRIAMEKLKQKIKKTAIIVGPIICICIVFIIVLTTVIIPNSKYNNAVNLYESGKYEEAIYAFTEIIDYKDSKVKKLDALSKTKFIVSSLSTGYSHTVGLKADGTVVAVGKNNDGQCDVSNWKNIVAISAGSYYTVGLKADGTVVAVGNHDYGRCEVSNWENIITISAGSNHTVGLKADGTVVAVGDNIDRQCNVSNWKDIIAISAGSYHTVGLKADGTVVAVGYNIDRQCNVSNWKDIVVISAGGVHTVGLKADGTVVAVGYNNDGRCNVSTWKNIVAISAGSNYTVGLKADGSVVAVGYNYSGQCNVSNWKDIIAISAGRYHTVGLKADGTVVAVGENDYGQCNVSNWKDILVIPKKKYN